MAGKGFKDAIGAQQPVYGQIIGAAQEETKVQEEQKAQEALEALKTQGKKGLKAGRINMAFTPSNMDFIRVMAAIQGQSMTQFVNAVIERERERNGAAYEAAKQITKNL